ncbi:hypothetical protein LP420_31845 [Massilia sp. B-10]|nr:hypothetical protein LP420_31845 [Massilia sp. B-10]
MDAAAADRIQPEADKQILGVDEKAIAAVLITTAMGVGLAAFSRGAGWT